MRDIRHHWISREAIPFRCKKTGLTQERLAEKVELNPKYLGKIERDERIISIEAHLRIAKAVKTPVYLFFRGL